MPQVIVRESGPNLLLRLLYFVVFGLWLSGVWTAVAWTLCVTVIGLPVGLWMLNRLPMVATLHPSRVGFAVTGDGRVQAVTALQRPFLLRAAWFFVFGWWLSAAWLVVAWAACATWIGLPVGFWMFNRVPAIITLARS